MYLHLGHDTMVNNRKIIAILNFDLRNESREVKQFFSRMRAEGKVNGTVEDAKSMILCDDGIMLSNISTQTLLRRVERGEQFLDIT